MFAARARNDRQGKTALMTISLSARADAFIGLLSVRSILMHGQRIHRPQHRSPRCSHTTFCTFASHTIVQLRDPIPLKCRAAPKDTLLIRIQSAQRAPASIAAYTLVYPARLSKRIANAP